MTAQSPVWGVRIPHRKEGAEIRPERDLGFLNKREACSDICFRKINLQDRLEMGWDWGPANN